MVWNRIKKSAKLNLFIYVLFSIFLLFTVIAMILPFFVSKITRYISIFLPSHSGDLNSWTGYYGSIFGCIIGGAISVVIAFYVAKKQIDAQIELNEVDRKKKIRMDIEIETAKTILPAAWLIQQELIRIYLFSRNLIRSCIQNNNYFVSNRIDNNSNLFCEDSNHEKFLNELNLFFDKNFKDFELSIEQLHKYQNTFLESYLSRRIVIAEFAYIANDIIKLDSEINISLRNIYAMFKKLKQEVNNGNKAERNNIEELIKYFNDNFIENCYETRYLLIKFSNEISNKFYGDVFLTFINNDEIDDVENKFEPLNWDDEL